MRQPLNFRVAHACGFQECDSKETLPCTDLPTSNPEPTGATDSRFYEIRSADDALLKRDGGFATQDAAKIAGRADAKRIRNSPQPGTPEVGRILVGHNAEKPTR